MRNIDFSSWQSVVVTLIGLIVVSLVTIGIRLIMMMTVQQRRERMNRQINERLKILIAAYKTLGGSFTGTLTVDPAHLRDLKTARSSASADGVLIEDVAAGSERRRRIRDSVEAALSDIMGNGHMWLNGGVQTRDQIYDRTILLTHGLPLGR